VFHLNQTIDCSFSHPAQMCSFFYFLICPQTLFHRTGTVRLWQITYLRYFHMIARRFAAVKSGRTYCSKLFPNFMPPQWIPHVSVCRCSGKCTAGHSSIHYLSVCNGVKNVVCRRSGVRINSRFGKVQRIVYWNTIEVLFYGYGT
jgi:hypothetical protein